MAEEIIEEQKTEEEGVEIELDAPEESKEETKLVPESEAEPTIEVETEAPEENKDEVDEYGAKVQARIKKLTDKYRKEERDREEAVRMAECTTRS